MFQTTIKNFLRTRLFIILVSCCFLCLIGSFTPVLAYAASAHTEKAHIALSCPEQKLAEQSVYSSTGSPLGLIRLYGGTNSNCDYVYGAFLANADHVLARTVTVYTEFTYAPGYTQSPTYPWPNSNTYFRAPQMKGGNTYYGEVHVVDYYGKDIWASSGNAYYCLPGDLC